MVFFELALGFLQMSLYSTHHALSRQVKALFSDHKSGMPLTKFLKEVQCREQNILRYFKFIATPTAGGQLFKAFLKSKFTHLPPLCTSNLMLFLWTAVIFFLNAYQVAHYGKFQSSKMNVIVR